MTLSEDHRRRLRDIVLSPAKIAGKCDTLDELLDLVRADERERVARALDARDGRDEHRGWADVADFVRGMQ